MAELKCPHCGTNFTVDDTELASLIKQVRDKEFDKDLHKRLEEAERTLNEKHSLELNAKESQIRLSVEEEHKEELEKLRKALDEEKEQVRKEKYQNQMLQTEIDNSKSQNELAVLKAVQKVEEEKRDLERDIQGQKDHYETLLSERDKTMNYHSHAVRSSYESGILV